MHPATGYWQHSHSSPFHSSPPPLYAELGCNRDIPGACDPLYALLGSGLGQHIGIFDGGPFDLTTDDANYHHTNTTRPGHVFDPGVIDRWARPAADGGIEILTKGPGNGACPKLNELGGQYLFYTLDKFIQCHLAGGCHPVP